MANKKHNPQTAALIRAEKWWAERARADVTAFFEYVSGLRAAEHHRRWLKAILEHDRVNIIAPRESGKTSLLVYAMLWNIGRAPLSTNAIISVSSAVAEDRLRMLRGTMLENPRFRNVFPHVVPDTRNGIPNTQVEMTVKRTDIPYPHWRRLVETQGSPKDPTLVVGGVGSRSIIGRRFSGILMLDDIIDESDLNAAAQERIMRYLMQTLVPAVKEGGKIVHNDVPEQLSRNPVWHTIDIPAILKDENGEPRSYWPEVWPLERLERKRQEIANDAIFNIMYMNNPTTMTSSLFTLDDLKRGLPLPLPPLRRLYITTDQAISMSTRSDWTVYQAVGVDEHNNYYLLDMLRFKGDPDHQLERLSAFHDHCSRVYGRPVDGVLFENVAMQTHFVHLLNKSRPDIVTYAHAPKGDKHARAALVSRAARSGKLFFNLQMPDYHYLVNEWLNFPLARHDDTLDAISLLLQFLSKTMTVKEVRFIRL
jgi:predicted phage terminase large subunit-like protein